MSDATKVTIVDTSIEAWLDGAAEPDPKGDFGRPLVELVDTHKVDREHVVATLENLARALGGGT